MYERAIDTILAEYWKDYAGREDIFQPIYLTNDLVRYWKVLCLNYEANTRSDGKEAKRRLLNYKLKHSRLLTCYSAILYFCHLLGSQKAITIEDARQMTRLTPIERLTAVRENPAVTPLVDEILEQYVDFLRTTEAPKAELLSRFEDPAYRGPRRRSGQNFGDLVFELLVKIGSGTTLFRYLVV